MRVAVPITLTDDELKRLQEFARGRSTPARVVLRAKIVLHAAAGMLNKEIARSSTPSRRLWGCGGVGSPRRALRALR